MAICKVCCNYPVPYVLTRLGSFDRNTPTLRRPESGVSRLKDLLQTKPYAKTLEIPPDFKEVDCRNTLAVCQII